jgi:hypothetical protein
MPTHSQGARVLLFGAGDAGLRIAQAVLGQATVSRLVIAEFHLTKKRADIVAMMVAGHERDVVLEPVDATDPAAVTALVAREAPDLIVQTASLISPWWIIGRDHPIAASLGRAGIGLQLPCQLTIPLTVMRCVRDLGLATPVANLSVPDCTHPVLASQGLAPTIGLGNASILHLRARATPLRVIGHHSQLYDAVRCRMPEAPDRRIRVYVGENFERDDALAYEGPQIDVGTSFNMITAYSALPVIKALLPDAAPIVFSAPAPAGLPGGYPVSIRDRKVALDLPPDVTLSEAVAQNQRAGRQDGIETIEADGTVVFTEAARAAVADLDPRLAEPLRLDDLEARAAILMETLEPLRTEVGSA